MAVIGAVESVQAIERGQKVRELSVQQVIDCSFDPHYDNFGCLGGQLSGSLDYLVENLVVEAKHYPFTDDQSFCM